MGRPKKPPKPEPRKNRKPYDGGPMVGWASLFVGSLIIIQIVTAIIEKLR